MKIEKNNIKLEVNKPEINFDEFKLEQAEKEKLDKQKAKLIIVGALSAISAVAIKVYKAKNRHNKK